MALEILRHDQHTAIPGGKIRDNRFFGLRTLLQLYDVGVSNDRLILYSLHGKVRILFYYYNVDVQRLGSY